MGKLVCDKRAGRLGSSGKTLGAARQAIKRGAMLGHSDYDGGVPLHVLIESAIDNYEQDREECWKSEGHGGLLRVVDDLATAIVKASRELVQPSHMKGLAMAWDQARGFADIPDVRALILEKIQIEAAWEFANDTASMAQRYLDITDQVLEHEPGQAVLRFLRRVSRCFVAGFYPETIILCRAVLENALREKYDRERKPLPSAGVRQSDMSARLAKAEDYGWLTRRHRTDAWTIWKRGSKAVHEDPTVTSAAMDTIHRTISVLVALYSPRGV